MEVQDPPSPSPPSSAASSSPPSAPRRRTLLRGALLAAPPVALAGLAVGVPLREALRPDPRTRVDLRSATVAMDPEGVRHLVGGVAGGPAHRPGTRLTAEVGPGDAPALRATAFLAAAAPWLAGVRDREGAALAGLAEGALWDLWVLGDGLPAPVAGWSRSWRYLWPRDVAFCAVALARVGLADRAVRALEHLQSLQRPGSWFEARYVAGTATPPDDRHPQYDGTGLVLWAAAEVLAVLPEPERTTARETLDPLVSAGSALLHGTTAAGTALPPVSPDYWEVRERSVTLGVMAATLSGLRAARALQPGGAVALDGADAAFAALLAGSFGAHGMQRYARRGGQDSALALLAATGGADLTDAAALRAMRTALARPAGGIAPGAAWKRDGISWTPSTSLLGLAFARVGAAEEARGVLDWLAAHRTEAGSLPEKVLFDGTPAAVAPLAWTAANVLLTLEALRPASGAPDGVVVDPVTGA